ncbi:S9 family peptidase [Paenibacillus glycinis]|uniref:Prolyl oligopeptidase family serine peptidase n=1 Tax=Paenibacillus glycinis TaxID=2697035 RepID=A0ABW9XPV9_9BACL|nr:S9 family peptidase [Paenibacillus glycinis]NBD24679.1 prolyl oligopeptidase family serine peptidase [Paenibacillus glycinis]
MGNERYLTAEDLYKMNWINDPAVSPASGAIAYVLKSVNEKHDGYRSHIRLLDAEGGESIPFTSGEADAAPAWSPDGSELAFLRKKDDKPQVWVMPARGGEARPVTALKHGAGAFKWSPDGRFLLVKGEAAAPGDAADQESSGEGTAKPLEEQIFDRLNFKADGRGLWNGRRTHLHLVDRATEACTRLTEGNFDVSAFAWSPDGARIAYSASVASERYPDPDLRLTGEVFVMDRAGGSATAITDGTLDIHSLAFTPDGERILLIAGDLGFGFATLDRIRLVPVTGGDVRVLFQELDVQLGHVAISDMRAGAGSPPLFSKDGRSVYLQLSRDGSVHIGRFALDGSSCEFVVAGEREIYQFDLTPEENIVFAAADPLQPGDLFRFDSSSSEERRLTRCNENLWSELALSVPESFTFQASDGWPIQGWLMKPNDFKEGAKVPAVLEIHGGPQAMYAHTFMLEFQLLTAAGFAVFYTNPRGGHGYGQSHVNTVRGDYGGRDYQDLMEAADYVLDAYPFIDASRLGVTGGSYGGFMTNWIVGHSNRFRAAVTQRSISNWISFYGVSDIGPMFTEDQIWGNPWDDLDKLWRHSPLAYVKHIDTPLLILHGEQDLRCPIEQGEQLFVALKRLGKQTQLIRFPGADHNLSRSGHPHLRTRRLHHIVRWFEEHIER